MKKQHRYLWAKYDKPDKKLTDYNGKYHPLIYHMIDSAMVSSILWRDFVNSKTRDKLVGQLGISKHDASKWIPFLTSLHDLGKANPHFQFLDVLPDIHRQDLINMGIKEPCKNSTLIWHAEASFVTLNDAISFASQKLSDNAGLTVARILGGHHGVFPGNGKRLASKLKVSEKGCEKWGQMRKDICETLYDLFDIESAGSITYDFEDNFIHMALSGIITLADWIASDTDFFPYANSDMDINEYVDKSKAQAKKAIESIGWTTWHAPKGISTFEDLFPEYAKSPKPVQKAMIELINNDMDAKFVIVEAQTGEGKTEASLLLQNYWCHTKGQNGMYFALPTTATSNQMFKRISKYMEDNHNGIKVNLHLLHSYAVLSDDYKELKARSVNQDATNDHVVAHSWFSSKKRGLLSPFAVGTIDQAMLAVLHTKHMYLRLLGMTGKTVVFDEVHAYDTYMTTILEGLLKWFAEFDTTVIMLSATLPKEKRKSMLQAYTCGDRKIDYNDCAYPRITMLNEDNSVSVKHIDNSKPYDLNIEWLPSITRDNPVSRESINLLDTKLAQGGCCAYICNSVNRAQDTYRILRDIFVPKGFDVELFHARYPQWRRNEIEEKVLYKYGKDRHISKPTILVASQVIEQSLDLDFDMMITELSPGDLVLQRAGRLHRHPRKRSPLLQDKVLHIIRPNIGEDGRPILNRGVYRDAKYIMHKTWLTLIEKNGVIRIPDDTDDIIEKIYSDNHAIDFPNEANYLNELYNRFMRSQDSKEFKGMVSRIEDPDDEDGKIIFTEDFAPDNDDEMHRYAMTRLQTMPTRSIICMHEKDGNEYLDQACTELYDPNDLNNDNIKRLLGNSVKIIHSNCEELLPEEMIPDEWKEKSLLCHHRKVVFKNNQFIVLTYDEEFGIIIDYTIRI